MLTQRSVVKTVPKRAMFRKPPLYYNENNGNMQQIQIKS